MKNLQSDRPIDVETSGLSVLKIEPDGNEEQKTRMVNPQISITTEATATHGITDGDVAGEPEFRQVAVGLREYLGSCDIAGFGVSGFNLPILEAEFRRAGWNSRGGGGVS